MKTLTTITTLILSFFFIGTALAGGPTFVVEENGNEYIMYLRLDDVSNIESVLVEGDFSRNGINDALAVNINNADLNINEVNMAQIQKLNDEFDYANYVVKVLDKDGYISEYPVVKIALSDFDATLASAE